MSDLTQIFLNLNPEQRRNVQLELGRNAFKIWENYAAQFEKIVYFESVVGTRQIVDKLLPSAALEAVLSGEDTNNVGWRYAEPINAMQDEDLVFPDHIEFAYYAVYNLFKKYVLQENIDDWLICNQALSAETNPEKWADLLNDAILKSL
jgi:hypothetical protein